MNPTQPLERLCLGELHEVGAGSRPGSVTHCGTLALDTLRCPQSLISKNIISAVFLVMLIICGALVNGPYALITTAVSADLVSGLLLAIRLV